MKATFENSVNVLVNAYFDDTLQLRNCHACAVGNLIASANNYRFTRVNNIGLRWNNNLPTAWFKALIYSHSGTHEEMMDQILSTGYSVNNIIDIENAFEGSYRESRRALTCNHEVSKEELETHTFNGLMAVVDILAEIHNVDLEAKNEAKAMFVKA